MSVANAPDLRFVAAKPDDFDYFYALRKTTMTEHLVRVGKGWDEDWQLESHRRRFDVRFLHMIFLNENRVGFICVQPIEDAVSIELFCIEQRYQKRGIGQRVLELILAETEVKNKTVILDVLRGNPAAHLYERLGFARIREDDFLVYYALPPKRGCEQKAVLEALSRD